MSKYSVLIIYPGPVPPDKEPDKNRCFWISDYSKGWAVQPIWWNEEEMRKRLNVEPGVDFAIGDYKFSFIYPKNVNALVRPFHNFYSLIKACRKASRTLRPDLIFTYGTNSTGIAGAIMKLLTGSKLVVEIPGVPSQAFIVEERHVGISAKIKKLVADGLLYVCLYMADGVKLLFPTQLKGYQVRKSLKRFCFHDLTPVSAVKAEIKENKTLLFLGFPWHRKGVDVLIKAFKLIEKEFPDYTLDICGHCLPVDRPYYESLAGNSSQIILGKGVKFDEAIIKLAECSVMVLPSRTEAMGRVNLEALFLKKPIVAAAVDGIPYYVKDGETGLLFKPEDHEDLANKLRTILTDHELRKRLVENGYESFVKEFSEQAYAEKFQKMLQEILE